MCTLFHFGYLIDAGEQLDCHEPDSGKPLLSEIQFLELHLGAAVENWNS